MESSNSGPPLPIQQPPPPLGSFPVNGNLGVIPLGKKKKEYYGGI